MVTKDYENLEIFVAILPYSVLGLTKKVCYLYVCLNFTIGSKVAGNYQILRILLNDLF